MLQLVDHLPGKRGDGVHKKEKKLELKPVLVGLGGEKLMDGALGSRRGNKFALDPSAEVSI